MPDLNIKNPETYRLVKELADRTGESMTAAVTDAVREKLDRLDLEAPGPATFDVDEILAMAAEIGRAFPDGYLEHAIQDLYDENGLPR
jgi:antitoxin VapB